MLSNEKWKDYPRGLRWFAYISGILFVLFVLWWISL